MNTQQPYQVQGQIPYTQGNPGTGQPPQYAAYPHPAAQGNYPYQPGYPPNQEYPNNQTTVPLPDQHVSNSNVDGDYEAKSFEFNDKTIRRGFIRRVYGLLSVQLLATFGLVLLFCLHEGTKQYAKKNIWLMIVALIIYLITSFTLICCEGVRRAHPINMIFLAIFTLALGILVGFIGSVYDTDTVLIAAGLTVIVVVGLTIFALQTKWDFTVMGGGLFIAGLLFLVISIIASIIRSHYLELIISFFGVLLFGLYLIYDTQLIVGGNHKYTMSPEEYVLGALTLYLDIINLFLHILRIVASMKK